MDRFGFDAPVSWRAETADHLSVPQQSDAPGNLAGAIDMDLSRFRSDLKSHLSGLSFESQGAFPSEG